MGSPSSPSGPPALTSPDLQGRKVVTVGAGRTGVAVARFCSERGATVTLVDDKFAEALGPALGGLPPAVRVEAGPLRAATLGAADLIVLSPGVPVDHPAVAAAQQAGVRITGEIELASRYLEAPLVAITGTNGKSTVTLLCGEIARATGRPTFVGGNFGVPLVEAVGTEAGSRRGIVVCEVSSFQLETADTFHPRAAAVLNITPDHLDRHGTMEAYAAAKMRVARHLGRGDALVLGEDDPAVVAAWRGEIAGQPARAVDGSPALLPFTTVGRPRLRPDPGADGAPAAEVGGFLEGETLVLRLPAGAGGGAVIEERYPSADLALVGRHNLGNALAAFLLMRGPRLATPDEVLAGARAFRPLPHRMQLVAERAGVRYYDDSKGTNVAAVVASIDGFPRPFVLLAGGRDKGGSYAPLREALGRNRARAVIVLGEAADRIAAAVEGVAPVHRAASMEQAVALGASLATGGDAVVLSPACSSYDMFRNYEHRGQAFREAVEKLRDRL